jgi:hypothetical protein
VRIRTELLAEGRRLEGSEAIVSSAARSWYLAEPDLISTHRDRTLAAVAAG